MNESSKTLRGGGEAKWASPTFRERRCFENLILNRGHGSSIYDVHKKIMFSPSSLVHMRPQTPHETDPTPLWTSTCRRHEIYITLLKQCNDLSDLKLKFGYIVIYLKQYY